MFTNKKSCFDLGKGKGKVCFKLNDVMRFLGRSRSNDVIDGVVKNQQEVCVSVFQIPALSCLSISFRKSRKFLTKLQFNQEESPSVHRLVDEKRSTSP